MRYFVIDFVHYFVISLESKQTDFEVRRAHNVGNDQRVDVHSLLVAEYSKCVAPISSRAHNGGIVVVIVKVGRGLRGICVSTGQVHVLGGGQRKAFRVAHLRVNMKTLKRPGMAKYKI